MKSQHKYFPIFYLAWIMVVFLLNMPMPYDDLLRDIVAGNYHYNYAELYVFAPYLPKYNQYIFFDIILNRMALLLGNVVTVHLIQTTVYLLFMIPSYLIIHKILQNNQYRDFITTAILLVIFNDYTMLRLVLARPEMFFTCWLVWGILVKTKDTLYYKIAWFIIGVLMIPFYWLAFFYVPIVFIVFNTKPQKILFSYCYLILTALFWQHYSHHQWLASIFELGQLNRNRLAMVGENRSIMTLMLTPEVMIAVLLYGYTYRTAIIAAYSNRNTLNRNTLKHSIKQYAAQFRLSGMISFIFSNNIVNSIILLLIPFCLLNMIRYSAIISLLIGMLLAIRANQIEMKLHGFTKYLLLCLVIFIPMSVKCYRTIPKFTFPKHSTIMATSLSNYYVPFYNSTAKVAPAMEIGTNESGIQLLMKNIDIDGTVSCSELKRYHFDYLVEKNLSSTPDCLAIYQVQPGWRAWRVIYAQ